MDTDPDPHRDRTEKLRARIARSLALEDAMATELGARAASLAARGDQEGADALLDAARKHRVGALKHRALMGAHGLDI